VQWTRTNVISIYGSHRSPAVYGSLAKAFDMSDTDRCQTLKCIDLEANGYMCQTVHSGGPFIVRQLHDMYIIRDQIGQETRTPVSRRACEHIDARCENGILISRSSFHRAGVISDLAASESASAVELRAKSHRAKSRRRKINLTQGRVIERLNQLNY